MVLGLPLPLRPPPFSQGIREGQSHLPGPCLEWNGQEGSLESLPFPCVHSPQAGIGQAATFHQPKQVEPFRGPRIVLHGHSQPSVSSLLSELLVHGSGSEECMLKF